MRLATAALVLLTPTAACDGGGDDDDDGGGGVVELEFADFQEAPLGECEVIGSVFNASDDRVCDVFVRHEAIDFDGNVIGDAISTLTNLPPDTGDDFAAPIIDGNGDFVFCEDVESIELAEFDDTCD
ncbi:MAG: FxLYD domain-containing protein [Candidatus Binatia bacterium]